MASVFIRCSMSSSGGVGAGAEEVAFWVPTLHLVVCEQGVEVVVLWVPNLPILER